jgi:alpha-1,2-mannosyltransferase
MAGVRFKAMGNPRCRQSDRYRRAVCAGAALLLAIDLIVVSARRIHQSGDFDVSMEFGRRFLAGTHLYRGGLHFPYLPAAAMFFSMFSAIPKPLAFLLFYSIAVAGLWLTLRMLAAMVCGAAADLRDRTWLIATLTLLLAAHYIIRDLDDGGPNLILLALATAGMYYAWAGCEVGAGGCLGAAAALKTTAAIFIPFLLWKRRWRLAAWTTAAAGLWMALPMVRMGVPNWWLHQREWAASAAGFAAGANAAAARYFGAGNTSNQALRPAVVYLLARAGLVPTRAAIAGALAAALLLAAFCLFTAPPYGPRLEGRWLREASGLLIMSVLLSPVTWIQHLVLAIPALYLIVADYVACREFGIFSRAALSLYVIFALVLNRGLLGKARYDNLLGWHVQTWCMILLLGVLLAHRNGEAATDHSSPCALRRPVCD